MSAAIDWAEIRRHIDEARAAIEQGGSASSAEQGGILEARARELAREPVAPITADHLLDVVEFELATERYGFELALVREVSPVRELTPVPGTPPFILGIMNLRGEIRTVIDVKKFFGLPEKGITQLNKIILIEAGDMQLGVLADAIIGVVGVPIGELQTTLPTLTGIRADYLRGITGDGLVVLDARKILSDPRILVYNEVET